MSGTTMPAYTTSRSGIDRIYDNVQAKLPGVAMPMLEMELWNTIEEFCLRSTFYRTLKAWTMAPNVRMFDFNPIDASMLAFQVLEVRGLHRYLVQPPALLIDNGWGMASSREGLALLALKPVGLTCGLPGDLFNRWFEAIMDGVLGRLMGQAGKPYSSPQLAEYHMRRFRVGINLARASAQELNSGQSNFRFPYFAGGQRKQ